MNAETPPDNRCSVLIVDDEEGPHAVLSFESDGRGSVFRIDFPQIFEVAGEARPAGSVLS